MAPRRLLMIASFAVLASLMAGSATAQCNDEPTSGILRINEASDLHSPLAGSGLLRAWVLGGFGTFRLHSWGGSSVGIGAQRSLGAVLRERRGLLR